MEFVALSDHIPILAPACAIGMCLMVNVLFCQCVIGLSHIRVSTRVSTAYRDTKGTSHVRRRYVGIRSSYSSIRSSYSSYAEVLRFLCVHLIALSHIHVSAAYRSRIYENVDTPRSEPYFARETYVHRTCDVPATFPWRIRDVSTAYVLRSIFICGVSVLYQLLFNTYENKRLCSLCSCNSHIIVIKYEPPHGKNQQSA